jgi:hypothetical protein
VKEIEGFEFADETDRPANVKKWVIEYLFQLMARKTDDAF